MRDHSREGRIRTGDLLVMSQASCQLLHIAMSAAGVAVAAAYKVREEVTWPFHTSFSLNYSIYFYEFYESFNLSLIRTEIVL